jgi:YD repeat-containing protein
MLRFYDARNRRTGAAYVHLDRQVAYTYDDPDRLTSETWTTGGSAPPPPPCSNDIQNLPLGNFSAFADPSCATPGAGTQVYAASREYDGAGNRTRQVEGGVETLYAYDAQNRLGSETRTGVSISYAYDKNGNQVSRTENGVLEQLSYDYMNRIQTYQKTGTSFLYRYMPTGERLAKANLATLAEEWFMYDGQDVTTDYARTGGGPISPVRSYVNGRAIDATIARIEPSGALHFYGGDAIGSVHEMIDTSGTIVRQSLYTAWGRDLPGFGALSFPDRYAFSHRELDGEGVRVGGRRADFTTRGDGSGA